MEQNCPKPDARLTLNNSPSGDGAIAMCAPCAQRRDALYPQAPEIGPV